RVRRAVWPARVEISAPVLLREHRRGDILHEPPRSRPAQPQGLRVPSARDASHLGPTGETACSAPLRVATAGGRLALARANSGHHQWNKLAESLAKVGAI